MEIVNANARPTACLLYTSISRAEGREGMEGFDVCIDKNAFEADGIIVLNRVKAHTSFQGPYESGLMKMLTIGLGKQYGAHICHAGGDDNMSERIGLNGREVIKYANVVMGVALIENAFDKTNGVFVMPGEEIPLKEPEILQKAKKSMGRIWFWLLYTSQASALNTTLCRGISSVTGLYG